MDSKALLLSPSQSQSQPQPQPQQQQQQQLQAIITFAMPTGDGRTLCSVDAASDSDQLTLPNGALHSANTKDKSVRAFTNLIRVSMTLMIAGVCNIALGCAMPVSEFISLRYSGQSPLGMPSLWSGFVFGVTNGALAIKAASRKPHISRHWARVNLGFGIVASVVHLAPLVSTLLSLTHPAFKPRYYYGVVDVFASDGARVVLCMMLLTADVCQLVAVSIALSLLRKVPNASESTSTSAATVVYRPASSPELTSTLPEDYYTALLFPSTK